MKQTEYIEGAEATEDFEEGMKSLFKVSKAGVVKAEEKRFCSRASSIYLPRIFIVSSAFSANGLLSKRRHHARKPVSTSVR